MTTYNIKYEVWIHVPKLGTRDNLEYVMSDEIVITTDSVIGQDKAKKIAQVIHPGREILDVIIEEN